MSKIGLFDSGLGGLTVARQLLMQKPDVSFDYVADIAHVPYGGRPAWQVRDFALGIVEFLINQGCDAIIMACNMSSAVALPDAIRQHPEVPIIGMIKPGAREAFARGASPIAVLATQGTVDSGGYARSITELDPRCRFIQTACPAFVPLIEAGKLDGAEVEKAVRDYTNPGLEAGAKTFILGCTHYPFLLPVLRRLCPADTTFVDPASCAVQEILKQTRGRFDHSRRFFVTSPSETFQPVGSAFLGSTIERVIQIPWSGQRLAIQVAHTPQVAALG